VAINANIPDAWSTYVTQTNLGLEVVPAHLYDTLQIQTGTGNPNEFRFFQQINVSPDVSNMKSAGLLPNPEAFLIQNIRVFFKYVGLVTSADVPDTIMNITNNSVGLLHIGNKDYGPWPLWTLGAANGIESRMGGVAAGSGGAILYFNPQISGPLYPLFPNLMLSPLQPFVFYIRSSTLSALTVPGGFPIGVQVLFDGQLARSIQ
jgi:hypothetical protein